MCSAARGAHTDPTLGALLVLHGPRALLLPRLSPWLLPAGRRTVPPLGVPLAQWLVERALEDKFSGRTAPSRAQSLLTMAATAWP